MLLATASALHARPVGAVPPVSATTVESPVRPEPIRIGYRPPVDAPVVDPFRPPDHRYGPGNRGLTYGTTVGQPVRAAATGRVAFAGPVAGRLVVSIDHPDGLRTTYTRLRTVRVRTGQHLGGGTPIGTADTRFHFGVRRGRRYLDPATLFVSGLGAGERLRIRVRLVPDGEMRAGRRRR